MILHAVESGTCPWKQAPARRVTDAWSESDHREAAQKLGLLRPWLLLASMGMQQRASVATDLGVVLSAGTPGKEAMEILLQDKTGISYRADGLKQKMAGGVLKVFKGQENEWHSSWMHILLRLLSENGTPVPKELAKLDGHFPPRPQRFKEARRQANRSSMDNNEEPTPIGQVERLCLDVVQTKWFEGLSEEDKVKVEEQAAGYTDHTLHEAGLAGLEKLICLARSQESEDEVPLSANLTDKLINIGTNVAVKQVASYFAPLIGQALLARNITLAVWGSKAQGCEKAVLLILLHRLSLAAYGIRIDTLMPEPLHKHHGADDDPDDD